MNNVEFMMTLDKEQYEKLKQQARERSAKEKKDLTVQDLVREALDVVRDLPTHFVEELLKCREEVITEFNQLQRLLKPVDGIKVEQTPEGTLVSPETSITLPLVTDKSKLEDGREYLVKSYSLTSAILRWSKKEDKLHQRVDGAIIMIYFDYGIKVYGPIPIFTLPQVDVSVFNQKVVSPFGPHSNFSDGEPK